MPRKPMRDYWLNVESRFKHHRHFVPSFIHFAAIDALDRQHVEDNQPPVDGHLVRWNSEHRNLRAMTHIREHFPEGARIPRHFESNVKPFIHSESFLDLC